MPPIANSTLGGGGGGKCTVKCMHAVKGNTRGKTKWSTIHVTRVPRGVVVGGGAQACMGVEEEGGATLLVDGH